MAWRCWLRGHCWTLHLEHGLIYLSCARCAYRTAGWDIRVYTDEDSQ
jgi:hypothetical protein